VAAGYPLSRFDHESAAWFRAQPRHRSRPLPGGEGVTNAQKIEAGFEDLLEAAPDGMVGVDRSGAIRFVNRQLESLFGYDRTELIGQSVDKLVPERFGNTHETHRQRYFADPRTRPMGAGLELRGRRRDGTEFPVDISLSSIETADGLLVTAAVRDVTERKRAEEALRENAATIRALNADLERRVEARTAELRAAVDALEGFGYTVSHDLRAPLRAIDGFSAVLVEQYADRLDAEGLRLLSVIRAGTRDMAELIDDLLAFSRVGLQELKPVSVDMRNLAAVVAREVKEATVGRDLRIAIGALPRARGDRTLLRLVLVNLLSNAVKFTGPRPVAQIEVDGEVIDGDSVYWVRDNGVGFDMEYRDKLFEVFQRLHSAEEFEGTGVGLAIVQRIVHRHGGEVWAEAEVDRGACFQFILPAEREVSR
jgi:PAS domain S-box-containing protein